MNKTIKWILLILLAGVVIVIIAGIYKFNYLANLDGYDPDGNRIEQETNLNPSSEPFNIVNDSIVEDLNHLITSRALNTHEKIMNTFKPKSNEIEGPYSYTITKDIIDSITTEVVLIELGLPDDSIEGEKTVMIIKSKNESLFVVSIKENFKCYQNRGHEDWGIAVCK